MFFRKNEDTRRIDRMQALLDAGTFLTFHCPHPEMEGDFREALDEMLDRGERDLKAERAGL